MIKSLGFRLIVTVHRRELFGGRHSPRGRSEDPSEPRIDVARNVESLCREIRDPATSRWKRIPLAPDEKEKLEKSVLKIRTFVPNSGPFLRIIALVERGAGPDGAPVREGVVTAPAPPPVVSAPGVAPAAPRETGSAPAGPPSSPPAR